MITITVPSIVAIIACKKRIEAWKASSEVIKASEIKKEMSKMFFAPKTEQEAEKRIIEQSPYGTEWELRGSYWLELAKEIIEVAQKTDFVTLSGDELKAIEKYL